MDKGGAACYYDTRILTLSVFSCVKGANMVSAAAEASAADFRCRALWDTVILFSGGIFKETRVAVMSIIVENSEAVEKLNALLHEYGEYIIGRMGIPYRKRKVNIIAIALDAPQNTISALSGKIGSLKGISVKTAYSGVVSTE